MLSVIGGCADPCLDDGLGQENCEAFASATDSETDGETESVSATDTDTATMTMTASATMASDSMSATGDTETATDTDTTTATDSDTDSATDPDSTTDTDTATDTDTDSDTEGDTLWCADADMDGFGDADACVMSDDPPPGTVDNDDDCDDGDADTFPGAAPNDDARACMNDDDGDDYGDGDADGDVVAGSDCDDNDIDAFPGAAQNEPGLCASDTDDDGWGDANPGGTADPGADCFDGNAALNPDTMALAVLYNPPGLGSVIAEVSPDDASLSTIANFAVVGQFWDPVSVTIDETGRIIANNDALDRLEVIDYALVCSGEELLGTSTALGEDHDANVFCGISFGADGGLYGIRNDTDEIVELDPLTGAIISAVEINDEGVPFDAGSCGMSFDCHTQQLLYAHGPTGDIFTIDPATGDITLVADTNTVWSPTGLAYEPVTRTAWLSSGSQLRNVALDGTNAITTIGAFSQGLGFPPTISNIEVLPTCGE